MLKKREQKDKSEQKQNMGKSRRWLRIVVTSLACLILAGVSFNVYSKYYKTGHNKGVSVASGFYFASNYMAELEKEDQSITDVTALKAITERLHVRASDSPWTGGEGSSSSTIVVDINNFANQLLYNDKDLDVSYKVSFILLESPVNVTYHIRKAKGVDAPTALESLTSDSAVSYTGELEGGRLSSETYEIDVAISDLNSYTPARILALAYPVQPVYVSDTGKIAGIITADYIASELKITEQGFTIEKELEKEGSGWKDKVKEFSGFEYQIRTTGSYTGDSETGIKKKLELRWKPEMYMLDDMDKYKQELIKKYKDDPDGLAECLNEAKGWMKVDILPYSSIKFRFYKVPDEGTKGFGLGVKDMTLDDFKASVQAEIK